jgi:hypothetical protein
MFITAGEAWRQCRNGSADSAIFGNVMRDHYALNDSETSDWDGWRNAIDRYETLSAEELEQTDGIARRPENAKISVVPPWKI